MGEHWHCAKCLELNSYDWFPECMACGHVTPETREAGAPKTYEDGIAEGLERAARYLKEHADDAESHAEIRIKLIGGLYRKHAAAIRALKE